MTMDLGPLRALVTDLNFAVQGVDGIVTAPIATGPVTIRGIWDDSLFETDPVGQDRMRLEPRHIWVIDRADGPLERGSQVDVAGPDNGDAQTWVVDGVAKTTDPFTIAHILVPKRGW